MAITLRNLFLKPYTNKVYWIAFALVARTIYYLLELHYNVFSRTAGVWGIPWGDTVTYFTPFENLLHYGHYMPNFRMPGYGFIYFLLILVFSKTAAYNIILVMQLVLSGIAVYALALTARLAFKNDFIFYITFYIFALNSFTSVSDISLLTESFTTSVLIFSVYYFIAYFNTLKKRHLLLSGIFLTWVFFLRPIFAPLFLVFIILLAIFHLKKSKHLAGIIFLFLLPGAITEGGWVTVNYIQYHKFMPLTKELYYPEIANSYLNPIWNLERYWGIDEWRGGWLTSPDSSDISKEPVPFPKYIYTSKCNEDSLRALKIFIKKSIIPVPLKRHVSVIAVDSMSAANLTTLQNTCNRYIQALKTEKPFVYWIRSRWALTKIFLMVSMYTTFTAPVIGDFCTVLYYICIVLGFAGMLLIVQCFFKLSPYLIFAAIPLYTIFIHATVLRLQSNRYLVPAYPYMLICAAYAIYWLYCKIYKKQPPALYPKT